MQLGIYIFRNDFKLLDICILFLFYFLFSAILKVLFNFMHVRGPAGSLVVKAFPLCLRRSGLVSLPKNQRFKF